LKNFDLLRSALMHFLSLQGDRSLIVPVILITSVQAA
jgi:hypothetical protein